MFLKVGSVEVHITRSYKRENGEARVWTSKLGDSRWVRLFAVMIIVSKSTAGS